MQEVPGGFGQPLIPLGKVDFKLYSLTPPGRASRNLGIGPKASIKPREVPPSEMVEETFNVETPTIEVVGAGFTPYTDWEPSEEEEFSLDDAGGTLMEEPPLPVQEESDYFLPPQEVEFSTLYLHETPPGHIPEDSFYRQVRQEAIAGDVDAMRVIGSYYFFRAKTHKWKHNSPEGGEDGRAAFFWINRAVTHGKESAQSLLADCFFFGIGAEISYSLAFSLYQKLAEDPMEVHAAYMMGQYHLYTFGIMAPCDEMAVLWHMKAAKKGHVMAQMEVAEAYQHGRGVDADTIEAKKWYQLAAEGGMPLSGQMDTLSPAELAEVQERVRVSKFVRQKLAAMEEKAASAGAQ